MENLIKIDLKDEKNKSIGERHIYTQEIIKLLRTVEPDETITYEEIDNLIGMDCKPHGPGYGYQYSARITLERENGIVFEVINKIGFRRLTNEKVGLSTASIYLARKKSIIKKHKRRIDTVVDSFEELSPEAKIQTTLVRTLLAFDNEFSKPKRTLQIESEIKNKDKLLGFGDTISLFEVGKKQGVVK